MFLLSYFWSDFLFVLQSHFILKLVLLGHSKSFSVKCIKKHVILKPIFLKVLSHPADKSIFKYCLNCKQFAHCLFIVFFPFK